MKKKFFTLALSALALTSMFVSCSESNNDPEPNANYAITLDLPLNQQNGTLSDTKATLTNVQTKQQYPANSFNKNGNVYVDSISVPQGLYNIEVTGKISYKVNGQNVVSSVKAKQENVNINLQAASNHNNNITMALNTFDGSHKKRFQNHNLCSICILVYSFYISFLFSLICRNDFCQCNNSSIFICNTCQSNAVCSLIPITHIHAL